MKIPPFLLVYTQSAKTILISSLCDTFTSNVNVADMRNIVEILSNNDPGRIYTLLTSFKKPFKVTLEEIEQQYDPKQHKVFDIKYRKKKNINVPTGKKDPITGKDIYKTKQVERVRIAIPVQKSIVERAVGFLLANPVEYRISQNGVSIRQVSNKQQQLFDSVRKVYHQNKIKYFDKRLARFIFRQREAAELWYMPTTATGQIDKSGKMRVKLLAPALGDKLYPHFNDFDDMDGFVRVYKVKDEEGVSVNHFDVYTDRFVYKYVSDGESWRLDGSPKQHGFTKIPIVYYRQEQAEWEDVQTEIERAEDLVSNWGDTNDYFGVPKYFVKGTLKGFAEKGEQGSVFQGEKDTDMRMLSWDNSPGSVTGELANLFSMIYSYSHSADVSFERMKEIGNNTSGAAIRLMFTDPHMNAQTKTELFGEMFTRRSNIVANGICNTGIVTSGIPMSVANDIDFEPIFKPYIPKNEVEELELIQKSTGGKQTTSQRRGIELNPLNDDADRVEQEIREEEQQALELASQAMSVGESSQGVEEE